MGRSSRLGSPPLLRANSRASATVVPPPSISLHQRALLRSGPLCPRRPSSPMLACHPARPWSAAPAPFCGRRPAARRRTTSPRCSGTSAGMRSRMSGRATCLARSSNTWIRRRWLGPALMYLRISYVKESFRPVILSVGVQPESLSVQDGTKVARSCQEILVQSGIINVDVEIRESLVTPLEGHKLLAPTSSSDPTVDVRNPLTPTLCLPISGKLTPCSEGSGGFFIAEGGGSKRLFLATTRHVVFKLNRDDNKTFEHKSPSAPRREVILLGDAEFRKFLESIQVEIGGKALMIPYLERRIAKVKDVAGDGVEKERKKAGDELAEVKEAMDALNTFYGDVSMRWASPDRRVLGHVVYSPHIEFGFGTEQYTQGFVVIEIDLSKINGTNLRVTSSTSAPRSRQ
ncbi:hypothetical protein L873DRAFT_1408743 [Choiromyces venosus 120613-1]|uniref:Uncharacterized protein n=1 Tax=Choiromyces venosus 120613-1 TaxID=1336337 RepID=A0A3N4J8D5_9PEZI|nr:hypothetical protein L873DRAFT_1408743 [Choiromyces venosus 120613-1]